MSANIYLKRNDDWEEKIKYGYVKGNETNLINRLNDSREEHSELSNFQSIITFKVEDTYKLPYKEIDKIISLIVSDPTKIQKIERLYNINLPLCRELYEYLVKSTTKSSNEFIQKDGISCLLRVLREEFHLLGLTIIKEYTPEELDAINSASREQVYKKTDTHESFWDKLDEPNEDQYNWNERPYQRIIIDYILNIFLTLSRIYLELATGGGKSYIIYKILAAVKPKTIVIFSPRKTINKQNSSEKYLSLLDNDYLVFNCSIDKDFDKFKKECERLNKNIMILACSQGSNKKVYKIIHKYNLSDIFIWYDEAHYTVENWITKPEEETETTFLLNNTNIITKRIFTSASPNKKQIEQNPLIFGELYSPIKVKDLIKLKWLCPIKPHIFSLNNNNIHICNYNLEHFSKFDCTSGFSFHNIRESAFNLFYEHYIKYIEGITKINPFLLVGDDYKNSKLDEIRLEYDFKSINLYEETTNSMGYVVQKYSIGYDFNKIDYIVFSDPKMSSSDIIQCLGRGIRPDGLGETGTNLNKNLSIMLPVYIESEIETDFNRIEQVLRYLVHDIDYEFENMIMDFSLGGNKKLLGERYNGENNMKAILLDLLRGGKYSTWKPKEFITLLKNNKINDREGKYNAYIKRRPELNLPEDPYRCFPDFTWEQTYAESPYYSKEECKKKIAQIKENNEDLDLDEEDEPEVYLNSIDPKIPPQCLFRFYGGFNNNEYY